METSESPQTSAPVDPWVARADELRGKMEALLEVQLHEYEAMNAKLEAWKQDPAAGHLTVNDYEPWQVALKELEQAHREFEAHLATRAPDAPVVPVETR